MSFFDLAVREIFLHNLKREWLRTSTSKLADDLGFITTQILASSTKNGPAIGLSCGKGVGVYKEFSR